MITLSYRNISKPQNAILLATSILLLPGFSLWIRRQVRLQKAALIPNDVWRNLPFLFICISMFFTWAAFNAFQYTSTLYFQDIQDISALYASLRFLPMAVVGILTNIVTGHLVAKVDVSLLLGTTAALTATAPVLMATASPEWTYWTVAFIAMTLSPINGDGEFLTINIGLSKFASVKTDIIPDFSSMDGFQPRNLSRFPE